MMIDNFTKVVENRHELIMSKFVCCLLGCSLFIQAYRMDSLTAGKRWDNGRDKRTRAFFLYVDKKKRAFFFFADKKEGDFPLCCQKRGRFS